MGHTNSTANLNLPQFIGTDKPTWLGDVNGAFQAIDAKAGTVDADIATIDAKADQATSDASNAVATANNASTIAGNANTTATSANNLANNALTVANNSDAHVNQLENKVGLLSDLHTTDKTSIVNAINEVVNEIPSGGSGLNIIKSVTADGVKTYSQILSELFSENANIKVNSKLELLVSTNDSRVCSLVSKNDTATEFVEIKTRPNGIDAYDFIMLASSGNYYRTSVGTTSNESNTVVPVGYVFNLYA